MRKNSCSDEVKLFKDFYQDVKYGVIAFFTDTDSKVREVRFTRDTFIRDTGIDSIS